MWRNALTVAGTSLQVVSKQTSNVPFLKIRIKRTPQKHALISFKSALRIAGRNHIEKLQTVYIMLYEHMMILLCNAQEHTFASVHFVVSNSD